ncbi:uncharacterized protein METZ01_LOCUS1310 [marine metagenome]|uniref:Uncharacterized protein n=1 Tax=marine metagenome TaxID=408172 RepID=A0A381N1K5_9ZZZZ
MGNGWLVGGVAVVVPADALPADVADLVYDEDRRAAIERVVYPCSD